MTVEYLDAIENKYNEKFDNAYRYIEDRYSDSYNEVEKFVKVRNR